MGAKVLIAQRSYPFGAISKCRYCILFEKLDGLAATDREQTLQIVELAINYISDKTKYIYSTLLLLAIQPPAQEKIVA